MMNELSPDDSISQEKNSSIAHALKRVRRASRLSRLEELLPTLSPAERAFLYLCTAGLALGALMLLSIVNIRFSTIIPARGGSLIEGETGTARFINPVLATSQADQDISALVFSGLMRSMPDGSLIPDLASSYTVSQDGTVYTFTMRAGATFQDGTPVTAQDVAFTVEEIQNPAIQSSMRANWDGVSVSSPDAHTVVFTLPHAYAPFIENTTLGILPAHLWRDISPEDMPFNSLNTHPVGSGPFRVRSVATDSTGAAIEYDLVPFGAFALGAPHLSHLIFRFYADDAALIQALNTRRIDAIAGITPHDLSSVRRTDIQTVSAPLPRVYGIFLNQSHAPVLADQSVREALDESVDKDAVVHSVLEGYGTPLNGPIPPNTLTHTIPSTPFALSTPGYTATSSPNEDLIANARDTLTRGGWKYDEASNTWSKGKQTLSFSLATADAPELVATAQAVTNTWKALGVQVDLQIYPLADLSTSVIRPRNYDALLFGEIVGRELDLYAFWESKERIDPGLNLALYANSKADTLLTEARSTADEKAREALYTKLASIIEADTPAVFLYSPDFVYIVPKGLGGVEIGSLMTPSERFQNAYQWYTDTERVWDVFAPSTNS